MQSQCNLPSRKVSIMWMIRKYTTTITKARMLPMDRDPTDLNHGPLSITRRTVMESMKRDSMYAKAKNTTRILGRIHLITTQKRMMTCGDDSVQARRPGISLRSCIYDGVMGIFTSGSGFGFTSVCFSPRRFIVVESIASGGLGHVSAWIIVPWLWGS
jgi:hypothetical protein